jgi:molybdopterin synthase sulfur carrier subunit
VATLWIPALLRSLTNGEERIDVPGSTVGEAIDHLEARYPGIKGRLCDGPQLRRGLAVVLGADIGRAGLDEPIDETTEVHFVQAIAGGSQGAGVRNQGC